MGWEELGRLGCWVGEWGGDIGGSASGWVGAALEMVEAGMGELRETARGWPLARAGCWLLTAVKRL